MRAPAVTLQEVILAKNYI